MNRLHPEDFIALSYHNSESADTPDPMEVMPGEYFPSVITSFPGAWVDRAYEVDAYGGFWASSKDLGIETVWQAVCDMLAEADINVGATISDDNSTVTATATLNFPLKIDNAKYGVEYVLVADGLTGTGQGWDQRNYYANGKQGKDFSEPEFKQFVEGDSYVSGLKFDDVAIARMTFPPLTTIHQDGIGKGRRAAEAIFALIDGENPDPKDFNLPVELVVRGTTAKAK